MLGLWKIGASSLIGEYFFVPLFTNILLRKRQEQDLIIIIIIFFFTKHPLYTCMDEQTIMVVLVINSYRLYIWLRKWKIVADKTGRNRIENRNAFVFFFISRSEVLYRYNYLIDIRRVLFIFLGVFVLYIIYEAIFIFVVILHLIL